MAKSTPIEYTRKWYLNKLCNALYDRVKVSFENQDDIVFIVEDSGIADKCDFRSRISIIRYREKMETLLQHTFLNENTVFNIKQKDGTAYTRENAIQKAIGYFKTIGSVEDDKKNSYSIDITQYEISGLSTAYLLYFGLSKYILEAIFGNLPDNDDSDTYSENIKTSFEQCLAGFISELNRQFLFHRNTVLLENQELYFDPIYSNARIITKHNKISDRLGDCNYAIPLTLTETFALPYIPQEIIRIPIGPRRSLPLSDEEEIKRLVSGYISISVENQIISSNEIIYTNLIEPFHQEQVDYDLSDVPLIDDRYFFFLTRIDKSILEARYGTPKDHEDLHKLILQRAKEQIRMQNSECNCSVLLRIPQS